MLELISAEVETSSDVKDWTLQSLLVRDFTFFYMQKLKKSYSTDTSFYWRIFSCRILSSATWHITVLFFVSSSTLNEQLKLHCTYISLYVYATNTIIELLVEAFWMNCCYAAWKGGPLPVALLRCLESCFNSCPQLVCIVWSRFCLCLDNKPYIFYRDEISLVFWAMMGRSYSK